MDLKKILNKPNHEPLGVEESLFLIKECVKQERGVDIEPRVDPYNIFDLKKMTMLSLISIHKLRSNVR